MADLVAVHNGLTLFRSGELGVIVDTESLDPFDAQPYKKVFSQLPWQTPDSNFKINPLWAELATSSFDMAQKQQSRTVIASGNLPRVMRVPKNVQENAVKALESGELSSSAQSAARSLASGSITAATVMRMRNYFGTNAITASGANDYMAHGGRAGQVWSAKTSKALLAAAGDDETAPPSDVDPEAPHMFMPDAAAPDTCAICGMPADDERHATEAEDALGATKYFGVLLDDTSKTFKLSALFALDEGGSWWERDQGDWVPAVGAPDENSLLELDDESFTALQTQIDDPDVEVAELSISEERLHELARPGLAAQAQALDAIFAAAPFVDPQVRSANAKKQVRDADGKFIQMAARIKTDGGVSGTVTATNDDGTVDVDTGNGIEKVPASQVHKDDAAKGSGEHVARLGEPLELVTDVAGRIQSYLDSQKGKNDPVTAAGEFAETDPVPPEPVGDTPAADVNAPADDATPASQAPGGTNVEPLYLAIVDAEDTQAVMDLVALIPADPASGAQLEAYRRAEGDWAPAPDMLTKLQGTTPPPVVELDAKNLADVLSQMDPPKEGEAPAEEPVAASGLTRFVINEKGALVASTVPGPALLKPFETYPEDVTKRIGEFVAGVEASPKDVKNTERLEHYWERGEGAAKIRWGTDGDWTRCVKQLSKYMGPRAKGYCTLRHKGALGYYPGELDRPGNPTSEEFGRKKRAAAFQTVDEMPTLNEFAAELETADTEAKPAKAAAPSAPVEDLDPEAPHEPVGDSELCELCQKPWDDPIHLPTGAADEAAVDAPPVPDEPIETHIFIPSEPDPTTCAVCGEPSDSANHAPGEAPTAEFAHEDPLLDGPTDPETGMPAEEPNWAEPHIYAHDPETMNSEQCMCGQTVDSPIHIVVVPVPEQALEPEASEEDEWIDDDTGLVILASGALDVEDGVRFRIPVVVPEGEESGDGRTFAAESLSTRDVPLALMWQIQSDEGHKQSVIVGRIDHVERLPEGGLGNAYGVFDTGEYGQEALRLVRGGMLRGISADLDEFEAEVIEPAPENMITSPKIEVKRGRLMGVTLVAKPAFANCSIEVIDGEDEAVPDGEYYEQTPDTIAASLVAAAAPVKPPKAWFENPKLDKPTPLTIDDEGRVFGHIATWQQSHIGLPYGTRPPRSVSNYAYFRTGAIRTAEGADIPVGQLTLAGGHAPLQADASAAVKHYDDTASGWADVAAGEDRHGIWVSGALRPEVTEAQVRVARASSPSGDWRPVNGALELVAACCVNVPGFPVARAMVASGHVTALVAAGTSLLVAEKQKQQTGFHELQSSLDSLARIVMKDKATEARTKLEAARLERQGALTASAAAAKARVDAIRAERAATLAVQADEARARVAALTAGLKYMPPFDEAKHPRDTKGRFRKVWARLIDSLGMDESRMENRALESAAKSLKEAADLEDSGDNEAAEAAGKEAQAALAEAARDAREETIEAIEEAARGVGEALARLAEDPEDAGLAFADLPEEVKSLLRQFVDEIEQRADPLNIRNMDEKVKAWVEGKGFRSAEDVAAMIASYLKQLVKPNPITKGGPMGMTSPTTYI